MKIQGSLGANNVRLHYLDNIRAIAMLLGVVLHASMGYSLLLQDGWVVVDTESSRIVDYIIFTIHSFRMPLFFLVAGFFTCMLIQQRGVSGLLKNRALRVGLPFIIFFPLLTAMVFGVVYYAAAVLVVESGPINAIKLIMQNPEMGQDQSMPIRTMHLWFLYYLIIFYLLAVVAIRIFRLSDSLKARLSSPLFLLVVFPCLASLPALAEHSPFGSEESFLPAPWAIAFFGLYFFVGWLYFECKGMLDSIERFWKVMLAVCVPCTVVVFTMLPETLTFDEMVQNELVGPTMDLPHFISVFVYTLLGWNLSLLCLMAGRKILDKPSKVMRFISDSSYWVYLIHIPFVFLIQAYFYNIDWPLWLEWPLVVTSVFACSLFTYVVFVRWTPIGWMLNGRKRKQTQQASTDDAGGRPVTETSAI